jgi:hypothetical protein
LYVVPEMNGSGGLRLIAAMRGEFNWADKKMHKPPIN